MAHSAAFFDLDRTLLTQSSGRAFHAALHEVGLEPTAPSILLDAGFGAYNIVGETAGSVALSRYGMRRAKGWPVSKVQQAGANAAEVLDTQIEPYGRQAMHEHRRAGRLLVMATASPFELVEPLSKRLGFDGLLATRQRISNNGQGSEPTFTGEVDGEFVWNRGKARSVAVWALANGVELADSYAYSDSAFDIPLLKRVGHPVAVNPDPRLLAYSLYRGWTRRWFDVPPGVPKILGFEPQDVVRLASDGQLPWVSVKSDRLHEVPAHGPALLVVDQRNRFDPYALAIAIGRSGRPLRVVGESQGEGQRPLVKRLARSVGFLDAVPETIESALRAGELVAARLTDPLAESLLDLARSLDVPTIEVSVEGSDAVWPTDARLPYVLNLSDPPTVTVGFSGR